MTKYNKCKLWIVAAVALTIIISFLSACGKQKDVQEDKSFKRSTSSDVSNSRINSENSQDAKSFSVSADDKSAKLPKGYPSEIFPIFEGSFIGMAIELEGSYSLTAYSKEDVKKVMAFYEKILKEAKADMETKTEESITSMGSIKEYSYTIDVGKTDEKGYKTVITISLQPKK